jgi:hypothetical protein
MVTKIEATRDHYPKMEHFDPPLPPPRLLNCPNNPHHLGLTTIDEAKRSRKFFTVGCMMNIFQFTFCSKNGNLWPKNKKMHLLHVFELMSDSLMTI